MDNWIIRSGYDDLDLSVISMRPEGPVKAVLQIVHGMAEHKERYEPLMSYLARKGIATVIHDHRGHGQSVKSASDLGFFYTGGWEAMVEDVLTVQKWAKQQFPGVPFHLLGHSMGSMVVRSFIKRYDDTIDGLIVCGSPSNNKAKGIGKALCHILGKVLGDHYRPGLIHLLSIGAYNKPFQSQGENAWLSVNKDNVRSYNDNPLCGFVFTCNGFINLFSLMADCYGSHGWKLSNPTLPVHFISGGDDPCRVSDADFGKTVEFLRSRGYSDVSSQLYPGLRHEILLENGKEEIFADIASLINK